MNTEKSQPSNSRTRAGKIPVSRKLQFVVVVFACVFFALLGLVYFSSGFSSAARAYVQGEGTWSKAQKEATIRLQEYAASRDEKDYQAFLDCLSVQLGDRIAREELEKPEPNYTAIYAGFRQGKIVSDVIMPKLRGPDLASRLRLRYPGMKVIYMSGYTESALAQDGMLERNTVLLQKPFTVKKILEVIQQMNVNVRS